MERVTPIARMQAGKPTSSDTIPRLLAEFSTEPAPGYSSDQRWTRLRITEIAPGEYLCEKIRGPEPMETRAATVSNFGSAKAFFGGGWVVRELFYKLDLRQYAR